MNRGVTRFPIRASSRTANTPDSRTECRASGPLRAIGCCPRSRWDGSTTVRATAPIDLCAERTAHVPAGICKSGRKPGGRPSPAAGTSLSCRQTVFFAEAAPIRSRPHPAVSAKPLPQVRSRPAAVSEHFTARSVPFCFSFVTDHDISDADRHDVHRPASAGAGRSVG